MMTTTTQRFMVSTTPHACLLLILLLSLFHNTATCLAPPSPTPAAMTAFGAALRTKDPSMLLTILSDIDGTLLTSRHEMQPETIAAVRAAQQAGFAFFPCTGRSRASMAAAVGPDFVALLGCTLSEVPGVYQQGLQVYGPGGKMIYEQTLDSATIKRVEALAQAHRLALIAYCGESIYCQRRCAQTDKIVEYKEPIPTVHSSGLHMLPSSADQGGLGAPVHKLIFLADDAALFAFRPLLEAATQGSCSITKAVPGMLEVLPFGSNKGVGVSRLLRHMGIDPAQCISFGDGENDVEMLQQTGLAVAVGNARDRLKAVAHVVLDGSSDEQAVAACLREAVEWKASFLHLESGGRQTPT